MKILTPIRAFLLLSLTAVAGGAAEITFVKFEQGAGAAPAKLTYSKGATERTQPLFPDAKVFSANDKGERTAGDTAVLAKLTAGARLEIKGKVGEIPGYGAGYFISEVVIFGATTGQPEAAAQAVQPAASGKQDAVPTTQPQTADSALPKADAPADASTPPAAPPASAPGATPDNPAVAAGNETAQPLATDAFVRFRPGTDESPARIVINRENKEIAQTLLPDAKVFICNEKGEKTPGDLAALATLKPGTRVALSTAKTKSGYQVSEIVVVPHSSSGKDSAQVSTSGPAAAEPAKQKLLDKNIELRKAALVRLRAEQYDKLAAMQRDIDMKGQKLDREFEATRQAELNAALTASSKRESRLGPIQEKYVAQKKSLTEEAEKNKEQHKKETAALEKGIEDIFAQNKVILESGMSVPEQALELSYRNLRPVVSSPAEKHYSRSKSSGTSGAAVAPKSKADSDSQPPAAMNVEGASVAIVLDPQLDGLSSHVPKGLEVLGVKGSGGSKKGQPVPEPAIRAIMANEFRPENLNKQAFILRIAYAEPVVSPKSGDFDQGTRTWNEAAAKLPYRLIFRGAGDRQPEAMIVEGFLHGSGSQLKNKGMTGNIFSVAWTSYEIRGTIPEIQKEALQNCLKDIERWIARDLCKSIVLLAPYEPKEKEKAKEAKSNRPDTDTHYKVPGQSSESLGAVSTMDIVLSLQNKLPLQISGSIHCPGATPPSRDFNFKPREGMNSPFRLPAPPRGGKWQADAYVGSLKLVLPEKP